MRIGLALASMALCALPSAAYAKELEGVWFLGGAFSDTASSYAGVVYSLPGSHLGHGLAVRASGNLGGYRYQSATTTIDGRYVGGELALVFQTSGSWGWANLSVGPRVTHTSLNPIDLTNSRRGTRYDVGLQTDGARDWPGLRARWFGALGPFDGAYQARVQAGPKFGKGRYEFGLEAAIIGDPSFKKEMFGAYVDLPLSGNIHTQIGSGVAFQKNRDTQAYGAIGLSSVF